MISCARTPPTTAHTGLNSEQQYLKKKRTNLNTHRGVCQYTAYDRWLESNNQMSWTSDCITSYMYYYAKPQSTSNHVGPRANQAIKRISKVRYPLWAGLSHLLSELTVNQVLGKVVLVEDSFHQFIQCCAVSISASGCWIPGILVPELL